MQVDRLCRLGTPGPKAVPPWVPSSGSLKFLAGGGSFHLETTDT